MPATYAPAMSWAVTDHALERFQQRVRDIERGPALREMFRMLPLSECRPEPPDWLDRDVEEGVHWRIYGDVAFLVRAGNVVITVYVRGGRSAGDTRRARRARARRRISDKRRAPRPICQRRRYVVDDDLS